VVPLGVAVSEYVADTADPCPTDKPILVVAILASDVSVENVAVCPVWRALTPPTTKYGAVAVIEFGIVPLDTVVETLAVMLATSMPSSR
jgi:hypothetical protein